MSVIDEVLAANEIYSRTHELRRLTPRPERKLAVLTCMDTRLSTRTLGLKEGDAHIIRNAGGIVTDDTLRSLVVSHYLLGTEEIMVINHTDCGLMHTTEQDLRTRIQNRSSAGLSKPAPSAGRSSLLGQQIVQRTFAERFFRQEKGSTPARSNGALPKCQ